MGRSFGGSCFNGAASRRRRKDAYQIRRLTSLVHSLQRGRLPKEAEGQAIEEIERKRSERFNGAASRRRRKVPVKVAVSSVPCSLQRGRLPKEAEGNVAAAREELGKSASTGPPPEG